MGQGNSKKRCIAGRYLFNLSSLLSSKPNAQSRVYKGIDTKSKEPVAIRVIQIPAFDANEELMEDFLRYMSFMKQLKHPNIVQFKDIVVVNAVVYIITEFCEGGDLRRYMDEKARSRLQSNESEVTKVFAQILEGMRYLNAAGIVHRDLKPENVLLSKNTFKVTDFGFSKLSDFAALSAHSNRNKPIDSVPALYLDRFTLAKQPVSSKCDIWSLGMILFELTQGKSPFANARTKQEVIEIQKNGFTFTTKVSPRLEALIRSALQYDSKKRISLEELIGCFGGATGQTCVVGQNTECTQQLQRHQ